MKIITPFLLFVLLLASCTMQRRMAAISRISSLRMIGVYELPHNLAFKGTTVGGLSGIDYDPV